MKHPSILISIATIVMLAAATGATGAADTYGSFDDTYGDDYQSGDLARLTSADNGVTIVRGHADDGVAPDEGVANSPVFAGDLLRTAVDQRVELQLADGSLVRLDHPPLQDAVRVGQPGVRRCVARILLDSALEVLECLAHLLLGHLIPVIPSLEVELVGLCVHGRFFSQARPYLW